MTSTAFADHPMANDSAQFPLGAPFDRVSTDKPSPADVRPWVLRGMDLPAASTPSAPRYDHDLQQSIDAAGRPLIEAGPPTVKNKTSNDGDEGPSDDYSYDYCPDEPFQI